VIFFKFFQFLPNSCPKISLDVQNLVPFQGIPLLAPGEAPVPLIFQFENKLFFFDNFLVSRIPTKIDHFPSLLPGLFWFIIFFRTSLHPHCPQIYPQTTSRFSFKNIYIGASLVNLSSSHVIIMSDLGPDTRREQDRRSRRGIPYGYGRRGVRHGLGLAASTTVGRRRPIERPIGDQAQPQPQTSNPPTQVVRPPLELDLNAPGPQQHQPNQPSQGIPPTPVVSPPLEPDSNAPGPQQHQPQHPQAIPPTQDEHPPLNTDQNAPGPQPNQPGIPMWRIPVYQYPRDPATQPPTYTQFALGSRPGFNVFRHTFPQMYITLSHDLPKGTIINVFHPAASQPIAVTPQDGAGCHTFMFMFAAPSQAQGQMVDPNPPAAQQPNPTAAQQPNPPTAPQRNPPEAGRVYRVPPTLLEEFVDLD
jgi:hypothetical protein